MKQKIAALLVAIGFASAAAAQPYTVKQEQDRLMALSMIPELAVELTNYIAGGNATYGSLIPTTDNTYDLGSAAKTWRTLYTGTSRIAKTSDVLRVRQDAQRLFTWDAASDTSLVMSFGDGGVTATQNLFITASTTAGDDDSDIYIAPSGSVTLADGPIFRMRGNEGATTGGAVFLSTGDVAGIDMYLQSKDKIFLQTLASATGITLDPTNGTITSQGTADIGWSVVNSANQACNTTCTSGCVVGIDTLGTGGFLNCAAATSDSCLCAGSS